MGRPRGGAVSSSSEGGEKAVRTSNRERKELLQTYNEESSHSEESEMSEEEAGSDYDESVSEASVSEPESSGSEYGKKKRKVSPKKVVVKGRGKKSSSVSPKKGGRKAVAKKASPAKGRGRKAATTKKAAATPTRSRPQRGSANKRMKYRDRGSDSEEEEESMELSESEVEEISQESEESEPPQMSDSEGEVKSRKRKAPGAQPKGRGAKGGKTAKAENGNGKAKMDEDEDEEEDEKNGEEQDNGDAEKEDAGEKTEEDKKIEETDAKIVQEKEKPVNAAAKVEEEADEEDEDVESLKGSVASSKDGELKNPTVTDYSGINLECDKKTKGGDSWNLKLSCWNVAGIRSWLKKNGLEYLEKESPDVMCVQEIKANEKNMPPEMGKIESHPHVYWSYSKKEGHNGVGIVSKTKPVKVSYGIPAKDGDSDATKKLKEQFTDEGRVITAEFEKYFLVNAYVPNSGKQVKDDSRPKPYPVKIVSGERLEWDRVFREYIKTLDAEKPVIVTGDLNCAHAEIDLKNPKTNQCSAGFTKEERDGFTTLLDEAKLLDSFRLLYPEQKDAYTFWSYRNDARAKNIGWRLDYFLISSKLQDSLVESTMRSKVLGSDHCPLTLFLHL